MLLSKGALTHLCPRVRIIITVDPLCCQLNAYVESYLHDPYVHIQKKIGGLSPMQFYFEDAEMRNTRHVTAESSLCNTRSID
jgi:hypothetical protein